MAKRMAPFACNGGYKSTVSLYLTEISYEKKFTLLLVRLEGKLCLKHSLKNMNINFLTLTSGANWI